MSLALSRHGMGMALTADSVSFHFCSSSSMSCKGVTCFLLRRSTTSHAVLLMCIQPTKNEGKQKQGTGPGLELGTPISLHNEGEFGSSSKQIFSCPGFRICIYYLKRSSSKHSRTALFLDPEHYLNKPEKVESIQHKITEHEEGEDEFFACI